MTDKPTIRAIAFDWGGIFTEGTFDSSAVRNLSALYGVPEVQVAETYFPLMEHFEAGEFDIDEFYTRFTERSSLQADPETFKRTFLSSVRERKAMYDLLTTLPEPYIVGMLSNNVAVLCDHVRNDPRMHRMDHFVFSNEIGVRKPDPKAFAKLTEALGVPPQETIFIDDNRDNVKACRELGYQGILLETYEGFCEQWKALLPDLPLPVNR